MELNNLTKVEILQAQVAQLREALEKIITHSRDADCGDHCSNFCMYCQGRDALAATPADAQAWLERQRKLAEADTWDDVARRCRAYVKTNNPECYACLGKIEPGYVEANDDLADIAEAQAEQLRKYVEAL